MAAKGNISGLGALRQWLGQGGIGVPDSWANARARVCAACPLNGQGGLLRFFTKPFAALIKKELRRKNHMGYRTPLDKKLGVCGACRCVLALKVHTPITVILAHLSAETRDKLDPNCWITEEERHL